MALCDLLHQGSRLVLVRPAALEEQLYQLVLLDKVMGRHGERQTPVVADVLAPLERVQQMAHRGALS